MKTRTRFIRSVIATSRQPIPDLAFSRRVRAQSARRTAPASLPRRSTA